MGRREELAKKILELMHKPDRIRNIGIIAHIDHGKTTLSDHLLAGAGMLSEELAGQQLVLDFDELEKIRGITIDASNVSMIHEYEGKEYLINLIDTPGHVDFGGNVTRALRAIDGCILVVCAVEGVMPQTETNLRQALKEYVKPVLFINKVDRLINELKLTPEQIQKRFINIIRKVNELIRTYAPEEFKDKWLVKVEDGSVAFGSAYHRWAISYPFMKKTGITFKDIIKMVQEGKQKELARKAKVHQVVLDMVIKHLPSPIEAQKYRIKKIWTGDLNSQDAKDLMTCNPKGKLAIVITDVKIDPQVGEVCTGRIFSGTLRAGQEVYLWNQRSKTRVQQVGVFLGVDRLPTKYVLAGNVIMITGLKNVMAGETITDAENPIAPFIELKHYAEPVVTVAVEPKNTRDLTKLMDVLKQMAREDPTLKVEIDHETGQYLLSGMGELHLEVVQYRLRKKGLDVEFSKPIVVYRETVTKQSPIVDGKTPNKHNRFYFMVEPLEEPVLKALIEGEISLTKYKIKDIGDILRKYGMNKEDAKGVVDIYNYNVLIDATKGVQYLNETMHLIIEGFRQAMDGGPLAREKCMGIKVKLIDAELHEDSVHRGPAQVIPTCRELIRQAILKAGPILLEPKFRLVITAPPNYIGAIIREVQSRRGQILDMRQEDNTAIVEAKAPVAELFGFASSMRSATEGRAFWSTEFAGFEKVPSDLQMEVIRKIRERKGLPIDELKEIEV